MSVIIEDFEDAILQFTITTTVGPDWFRTTDAADTGSYSLRAGVIGGNEVSECSVSITLSNLADITLRHRVSSEPGWDFLRVYLDDVEQLATSGIATEFSTLTMPSVAAGTHAIRLRYSKDLAGNYGFDTAFIDNITVTSINPNELTASLNSVTTMTAEINSSQANLVTQLTSIASVTCNLDTRMVLRAALYSVSAITASLAAGASISSKIFISSKIASKFVLGGVKAALDFYVDPELHRKRRRR